MKRIVFTGGGTAGHVTPNIALFPRLKELGYDIQYIGSYDGIEKKLIADYGIPYYGIATGKLRRYFDPKNFSDPFRVLKGFAEAHKILKELKPDVVFSFRVMHNLRGFFHTKDAEFSIFFRKLCHFAKGSLTAFFSFSIAQAK